MTIKRLLAAFALASLGLHPAAMAGDCWVKTDENAMTGFGTNITTKKFEHFRARLLKLEAVQRADPAINAINDVRYRLQRYVDRPVHPGAPMAAESSVWLHAPKAWKGECDLQPFANRIHFVALEVHVNSLRTFLPNMSGWDKDDQIWFYMPKQTGQVGGYPLFENRAIVLTAGGIAPFADVTVGEYLDDWKRKLKRERDKRTEAKAESDSKAKEWDDYIRKLEATDPKTAAAMRKTQAQGEAMSRSMNEKADAEREMLDSWRDSLSDAQLAQPVYISGRAVQKYRFGYDTTPDNKGSKLVKINPALWKGARSESDLRTLVLNIYVNDPPSAKQAQVNKWLENVDVTPYKALLQD